MTDSKFTLEEYVALSRKLHALKAELNEHDRRVLEAVFLAARIHVSLRIPDEDSGTGPAEGAANTDADAVGNPELTLSGVQQQILDAFIPGEGTDLMVYRRIGGDPTS